MTNGLPPGLSSFTPQGKDEATDDEFSGGGLDDIDFKTLFGGAGAAGDLPFDSKDKCPVQ